MEVNALISGECFWRAMGVTSSAGSLVDAFGKQIDLTEGERQALARLDQRERTVRRGGVIQRERDRTAELFVLRRGMMMSYLLLDDGGRQILRFFFPGDVMGLSGAIYRETPETISAITECAVAAFDRAALAQLIDQHPRLALVFLAINQAERVAITDRLAAVGRASAKVRVGGLLLELSERLGDAGGFHLPLTQEEIGDATGLTSVHVNRMMRQLEQEGLIIRDGSRVTLRDPRALARESGFTNRMTGLDLGWLQPGR